MIEILLVSVNHLAVSHSDFFGMIMSHINTKGNSHYKLNEVTGDVERGLVGLGAGTATTGCLGAGIGQGFSAGKAAEAIGRNPEAATKVRTIMIIGAAIAESGAIYSLLVAIILLFVF